MLKWLMWRVHEVKNPNSMISKLRRQRYQFFVDSIKPKSSDRVLDIGTSTGHGFEIYTDGDFRVMGLDLVRPKENLDLLDSFVVGNGLYLPFKDNAFDIVFCNAVMEHVTTREGQQKLGEEILRVGKRVFVSTNNRYFPIEPHYLLPLFQFYPEWLQKLAVKIVPIGLPRGYWERVRLMTKRELQATFPGCTIHPEKLWGMVFTWHVVKA